VSLVGNRPLFHRVRRFRRGWMLLALLCLGGLSADALRAQGSADTSMALSRSVEFWGGLARNSPQIGILGETPSMSFGQFAVRVMRRVGDARVGAAHWEYGYELVPFAKMSKPLISLRGTGFPCPPRQVCTRTPNAEEYGSVFLAGAPTGFGGSPIVIARRFATRSRFAPFTSVTGGALWFTERVPTTQSARFNFTASYELGVRIGTADSPGVTVAYRFHHVSNAGTGGENPGVASHLITVGIHSWRDGYRVPPSP
jgi:Lipid A 3-O-deacylase (PagL)